MVFSFDVFFQEFQLFLGSIQGQEPMLHRLVLVMVQTELMVSNFEDKRRWN